MHRHHIIPKHMGGTDCEDNLTPPISMKLHAEFHRDLWEHYGNEYDYIAWKCLSGRISTEEARLAAAKIGQANSVKYRETRKKLGENMAASMTTEQRSRAGKAASVKLVNWQNENFDRFKEQCSKIGAAQTERKKIPHEYLGVRYESKKDLQQATGMSICGFYGKLKRGEIIRLEKIKV